MMLLNLRIWWRQFQLNAAVKEYEDTAQYLIGCRYRLNRAKDDLAKLEHQKKSLTLRNEMSSLNHNKDKTPESE